MTDRTRRLLRLQVGLVLFGVGLALLVAADLGLPPWDVLHQGMSGHLPLTIGQSGILVGVVLLGAMWALREPFGIGTVFNVVEIGLVLDATLLLLGEPSALAVRVPYMLAGPVFVAAGSGYYLGAQLGPGPRDGLMTAMSRRGVAVWKARSTIEGAAFMVGVTLGGTVGLGTVWFLVSIGPLVQAALRRLDMGAAVPAVEPTTVVPDGMPLDPAACAPEVA